MFIPPAPLGEGQLRIDLQQAKLLSGWAQLGKGCSQNLKTMKKRFALLATVPLLAAFCAAYAGTLFTSPIIFVQPQKLDFGIVAPKEFATNSLVVENVGGGTLIGKVKVPPPFKITGGETYNLKRSEIQVVTIVYTPDNSGTNKEILKFSGADTPTSVTVIGRLDTRPPRYRPKHKKTAAP